MKSDHPRITLLGNNSGRNLGDAAIMSSILEMISQEMPDAEMYVPSIIPRFIDDHYGDRYRVKGINVMPWTGSVRLFGIPTFACLAKSDVALICDGIIFGKKLFNPAFNFLITLVFLLPWLRLVNCKLVCFSCGIGPFPGFWSRLFAKWVINASDLVIMREDDSRELAEAIGVHRPMEVTGDAAFVNPVSSKTRAFEIMAENSISTDTPILGINVTSYIDAWLGKSERIADKQQFLKILAQGVQNAQATVKDPFQVVLFSTQPMDEKYVNEFADLLDARVIDNSRYLSHDIQAVMKECGLLIGMRFHSLVLASAVNVPIVGLIYAPKVRGYMRQLGCEEYGLELAELDVEGLATTIANAWEERRYLAEKQSVVVEELKRGARAAATTLRKQFFPRYETESVTPPQEKRVGNLSSN